jgi:putative chitinase
MSTWTDFLKFVGLEEPDPQPGQIMIRFINRYMEPADGIEYLLRYEGKELKGKTTSTQNAVLVAPRTLNEIRLYAWSRKNGAFKLIETIKPTLGRPQLIYQKMKTYKQEGKTEPHPKTKESAAPLPSQKRPSPNAGPSPTTNQGVLAKKEKDANGAPLQSSERPLPNEITATQLQNIFPSCSKEFLEKVAKECNRDLEMYKLDTILRRAHFFAPAREEAGPALKANQESLNYEFSALNIFSCYRKNPQLARKHGRISDPKSTKKKPLPPLQVANQEEIGNHAYANRVGNGDAETGDGWRFRGRGIFQLTFRGNYKDLDDGYAGLWNDDKPDFLMHPEKVMDFPYTIRSAIWFWTSNKVYEFADQGATDDAVANVTSKINPPQHHLQERQKNFNDLTYPSFK